MYIVDLGVYNCMSQSYTKPQGLMTFPTMTLTFREATHRGFTWRVAQALSTLTETNDAVILPSQ